MKAIANLKKLFVVQMWSLGNPVQNVLEMVVLGESASQETHSLAHSLTVLVSQTKWVNANSANFQMTIFIH